MNLVPLPPEPTLDLIFKAPNSKLAYYGHLQTAHDFRRVVLEGIAYFKACEAGKVQPNIADLNKYKLANREFEKVMTENGWKDDSLMHELLGD